MYECQSKFPSALPSLHSHFFFQSPLPPSFPSSLPFLLPLYFPFPALLLSLIPLPFPFPSFPLSLSHPFPLPPVLSLALSLPLLPFPSPPDSWRHRQGPVDPRPMLHWPPAKALPESGSRLTRPGRATNRRSYDSSKLTRKSFPMPGQGELIFWLL